MLAVRLHVAHETVVAWQVIFGTKWIKKVGKGKIEVALWGKRGFLRLLLFFFFKKVWLFKIKAVPLSHENPPSLFTMLKSAGRFVLLWHIIQRHTHHQLSWWHCCNLVDSTLRMSHVRRIISATSVITDSVLISILFWQHRRRIMFSNQELLSIKLWTCIASTGIFAC